ncbi:hypothetical protein [uncultured Bradyrhizobium sp.]|uniref:hypothetical protein n=1 Tax=uncultured Bradyrhizobium sp. TaxID=199684 RepID=UPI0035CC8A5A
MTKHYRLSDLSNLFRPTRGPSSDRTQPEARLFLGNDLRNRLITFALGHGAVSARFDMAGRHPELVTLRADGQEKRTVLTGRARDWHLALDQHARDEEESERAGLNRFLRIRQSAIKTKTQWSELGKGTRYFDLSQLTAA